MGIGLKPNPVSYNTLLYEKQSVRWVLRHERSTSNLQQRERGARRGMHSGPAQGKESDQVRITEQRSM